MFSIWKSKMDGISPWVKLVDNALKSDDSKEPGAEAGQPRQGQHNKHNQGLGPGGVQHAPRLQEG